MSGKAGYYLGQALGKMSQHEFASKPTKRIAKVGHTLGFLMEAGGALVIIWEDSVPALLVVVAGVIVQCLLHWIALRIDHSMSLPTLRLYWAPRREVLTFRHSRITVGRQPDNVLTFDGTDWNKLLSRHHAEFFCKDGQWYLQDSGSVNHTYVNRKRLQPHTPVLLQRGDMIQFAFRDTILFDPPQM